MSDLKWVQRYYGIKTPTPLCNNEPCSKNSVGMWQTADGKGLDLCEGCRVKLGAPPMIEGIEYAPTMAIAMGYRRGANGAPEKVKDEKTPNCLQASAPPRSPEEI